MPVIGETKIRFGRSYTWLNPQISGTLSSTGTWRLNGTDAVDGGGDDISDFTSQATVAADEPTILANQMVYIDSSGFARLASAASVTTAKVAGFAVSNSVAGALVTYYRNVPITITNINQVVDNVTNSRLEPGSIYWLSAVNPGNLTRTPDTTTSGAVVLPVGLALDNSSFSIEIQNAVVI